MDTLNKNSKEYQYAKNRVKKLKGFYIHFAIYLIINAMIVFGTFYDRPFNDDNFFRFETFSTAIFWGIGLFFHGISVFGKNITFNKDWEEKKIQEFIEKDKKSNWE